MVLDKFSSKKGDLYQQTELTSKQRQIFTDLEIKGPEKVTQITVKQ